MLRLVFVIIAIPLIVGAQTPTGGEKAKTPAPDAKQGAKSTVGAAGMVVVKDPESGELRAPNAQEAATLVPGGGGASALRVASPEPEEFRSPVGQIPGVRLDDSFNLYSVATIGPDGKLKMDCIDSKTKAESAVKNAGTSKPVMTIRKEAHLEVQ